MKMNKQEIRGMRYYLVFLAAAWLLFLYAQFTGWNIFYGKPTEKWKPGGEHHYHK